MYISSQHETSKHEHTRRPSQETQAILCRSREGYDRNRIEVDRGFFKEGRTETITRMVQARRLLKPADEPLTTHSPRRKHG